MLEAFASPPPPHSHDVQKIEEGQRRYGWAISIRSARILCFSVSFVQSQECCSHFYLVRASVLSRPFFCGSPRRTYLTPQSIPAPPLLARLSFADTFEKFIQKKYNTVKRFGLNGESSRCG